MSEKGEKAEKPQITEPETVHCLFCSGIHIEHADTIIRIVGYADLDLVEYERTERRIVARMVMSATTARALQSDLRKTLAKGGH